MWLTREKPNKYVLETWNIFLYIYSLRVLIYFQPSTTTVILLAYQTPDSIKIRHLPSLLFLLKSLHQTSIFSLSLSLIIMLWLVASMVTFVDKWQVATKPFRRKTYIFLFLLLYSNRNCWAYSTLCFIVNRRLPHKLFKRFLPNAY